MYSVNDGAGARLSASWYGRAFDTALGPIRASTCGELTARRPAGLSSVQPRTANKQTNKQHATARASPSSLRFSARNLSSCCCDTITFFCAKQSPTQRKLNTLERSNSQPFTIPKA